MSVRLGGLPLGRRSGAPSGGRSGWRVALRAGWRLGVGLAVVDARLDVARRRAAEARAVDVHRHLPPAILQLGRGGGRLAAAASAVVGDDLARPRADEQRDELRPFVLRIDRAL